MRRVLLRNSTLLIITDGASWWARVSYCGHFTGSESSLEANVDISRIRIVDMLVRKWFVSIDTCAHKTIDSELGVAAAAT